MNRARLKHGRIRWAQRLRIPLFQAANIGNPSEFRPHSCKSFLRNANELQYFPIARSTVGKVSVMPIEHFPNVPNGHTWQVCVKLGRPVVRPTSLPGLRTPSMDNVVKKASFPELSHPTSRTDRAHGATLTWHAERKHCYCPSRTCPHQTEQRQ